MKMSYEQENRQDPQECQTLDDLLCLESSDEDDRPQKKKSKNVSSYPEIIGKRLLKTAHWADAAQFLTTAITRNPNKSSLFSSRAIALLKIGSFEAAEKDCTKALDLKKNSFKAYLTRALARKCQDRFIDACLDCLKLFDLCPATEDEFSVIRNEYDDMINQAIQEMVSMIIEDSGTKYRSGRLKKLRNEFSAKEKYFGNKLLLNRKYSEAIIKYSNAIRLNSKDPTFYANRALCWIELNNYKEAEYDCTKAIDINSDYMKVLIRRGRIRREMGNLFGAKSDFERATMLSGNDDSVREELRELEKTLKPNTLLSKNLKAKAEREKNE